MCVRFVCGGGLYKNGGEAVVLLIRYGFGLWYAHKKRRERDERERRQTVKMTHIPSVI